MLPKLLQLVDVLKSKDLDLTALYGVLFPTCYAIFLLWIRVKYKARFYVHLFALEYDV